MKLRRMLSMILVVALVVMSMPTTPFVVRAAAADITLTIADDGTVTGVPDGNVLGESFTYDGAPKEPSVEVTGQVVDEDYEVQYDNNTAAGEGKVTISSLRAEGEVGYFEAVEIIFEINPADLSDAVVTVSDETFNGSEIKAVPSVVLNGVTLSQEEDYEVSYEENADYTNVGTGKKVIVTGKGNYTGNADGTYTITALSLTGANVQLTPSSAVWSESVENPSVTVKLNSETVNSSWYQVVYPDSYHLGDNTIKVKPKNSNLTGEASATLTLTVDADINKDALKDPDKNLGHRDENTFYFKSASDVKIEPKAGYQIIAVTGSGATLNQGAVIASGAVAGLVLTVQRVDEGSVKGQNDVTVNIVLDADGPTISDITVNYTDNVEVDGWAKGIDSVVVTASDTGAGLDKVYYTAENESTKATASFGADGTAQLPLAADKTYTIYATDKLGNQSSTQTVTTCKVDGAVPKITIYADDEFKESAANPQYVSKNALDEAGGTLYFYISVEDKDSGVESYTIKDDAGQVVAGDVIRCTKDDKGKHVYTIKAVDKVGREEIKTFTVICDPDAPVITDVKLNDMAISSVYTKDENVSVSAKITDNVFADESQLKAPTLVCSPVGGGEDVVKEMIKGEDDVYSCTVSVADGGYLNYTCKIIAEDAATNKVESDELKIEIDRKAPVINSITSSMGTSDEWVKVDAATMSLTIEAEHDHGDNSEHKVKLYQCSSDEENWTPDESDWILVTDEGQVSGENGKTITYNLEIPVPAATVVDKTYYFKAVDAAGNESTEEKKYHLKLDNVAPKDSPIYVIYESVPEAEKIEKKDFISEIKKLFAKEQIQVKLYIFDEGSGVASVKYNFNGSEGTADLNEIVATSTESLDGVEGIFTEIPITLSAATGESIEDNLVITEIKDCVGNITTDITDQPTRIEGVDKLILDNEAPKLVADYGNCTELDEVRYYKDNATITLKFEEKYYKDNKDQAGNIIRPEISVMCDGALVENPELGAWTDGVGQFSTNVTLKAGEGEEHYYTILVKYSDRVGNKLVDSSENPTFTGEGELTSNQIVVDKKAPIVTLSLDTDGVIKNKCGSDHNREYYDTELELTVEVDEAYGDWTSFKDSISENSVQFKISDTEKSKLDASKVVDIETNKLKIQMKEEANYNLSIEYADIAGNPAKIIDETGISHTGGKVEKYYCYDKTPAEVADIETTITRSNEKGFWAAVKYGDWTYLFAKNELTITVKASDTTAGLKTIKVQYKGESKILSYDFPYATGTYEIKQLIKDDYKDDISILVTDWSENETTQIRKCIVETKSTHDKNAEVKIAIDKGEGRKDKGDYYRSDVTFHIEVQDSFSGIREYEYSYDEGTPTKKSYLSDDKNASVNDLVTEKIKSDSVTIKSSEHNKNDVKIAAKLTDNVGFTKDASKTIHIDKTAPIITVTYDLDTPANGKYYNAVRTATVTIKERNFDENDVEWNITNTMGSIPSHSGWTTVGSGDDAKHICTVAFREDGDYTFGLKFQDLAGNWATDYEAEPFTIDRTIPQYTVTYDNNNVQNGHYYNAGRTATIDVTEHNFDASLVNIVCNATKGGVQPVISGWRRNGDHNVATVQFSKDGDYTFDITGMDLANNAFADYAGDHFVIDTIAPKVEIFDITNMSANNGIVRPGVRGSDVNYDTNSTHISMKGYYNGLIDMTSNGTVTRSATGVEIKLNDFEHKKSEDDLYTMNAVVYDLAGNRSEASVIFSVNRFGSVYTFDEKTEELLGINGKFYTNAEREIVVVETNVDTLEFKEITCNANGTLKTLKEGEDYTVNVSGSDVSWKQYTYTIAKENFSEEGDYLLTIYSEDRAKNVSDNNSKGKKLEFIVDKTSPSIVVAGVENDGQYRENSREVILDVQDNVLVSSLVVKLNGKETVYTMADISDVNGRIVFLVDSANTWQTMSITAYDAAGNAKEFDEIRFLVTSNIFIQFIMNTPLVIGTVVALMALAGGFWFIAWKRRKKEN